MLSEDKQRPHDQDEQIPTGAEATGNMEAASSDDDQIMTTPSEHDSTLSGATPADVEPVASESMPDHDDESQAEHDTAEATLDADAEGALQGDDQIKAIITGEDAALSAATSADEESAVAKVMPSYDEEAQVEAVSESDERDEQETPEIVTVPDESPVDSNIRVDKPSIFETAAAAIDEPAEPVVEKRKPRRVRRADARRLAHYSELRREQYEEFNALLETLTHVDDLSEEQLDHVRDAIFHADHPFLLTMVGPFSAGKSSVINALLGEKVLEIGPIPTTDHIAILRYGPTYQETRTGEISTVFYPSELLRGLSLVDTPGLESVFEHHDEVTLKFLHRADIVVLVMLATQVLTAHDLDFMKNLRQVGKRLIIVVNQIDLLDEPDRQAVYNFVEEQSRFHLGFEPLIWLVSAKQALTAYEMEPRDEIIWDESGMAEVEEYLDETLDDAERVRQKLETPLQIAQNATRAALDHVRTAQNAISEHRKTVDNIEAQIEASEKERQKLYTDLKRDMDQEWANAIQGGEESIDDLFQFSRALGQTLGGVVEIIGIGAFFRRFRKQTKAQEAFAEHKVRESLDRITPLANKVGPTLEGRDLEDIDGLVDYTRQQMKRLPDRLQNKAIGKVQTPMSYDRKALRVIRGDLDDIVRDASQFETQRIDRALRSIMVIMALWEILVILLALLIGSGEIRSSGSVIVTVVFFLALALIGLSLMPLRGWMLRRNYRQRMLGLQKRFNEKLDRATHQQTIYGTQLRRDVVAPFTRLINTQSELTADLKTDLESHDQKITSIQHSLSALLKA